MALSNAPLSLSTAEWDVLSHIEEVRKYFKLLDDEGGEILETIAYGAKFQFVFSATSSLQDVLVLVRNTSTLPLVITRGARGRLRVLR
jgi:hypothetical protein